MKAVHIDFRILLEVPYRLNMVLVDFLLSVLRWREFVIFLARKRFSVFLSPPYVFAASSIGFPPK